jgi:hypothetical protein
VPKDAPGIQLSNISVIFWILFSILWVILPLVKHLPLANHLMLHLPFSRNLLPCDACLADGHCCRPYAPYTISVNNINIQLLTHCQIVCISHHISIYPQNNFLLQMNDGKIEGKKTEQSFTTVLWIYNITIQ